MDISELNKIELAFEIVTTDFIPYYDMDEVVVKFTKKFVPKLVAEVRSLQKRLDRAELLLTNYSEELDDVPNL